MKKRLDIYIPLAVFLGIIFLIYACHKEEPVEFPENGMMGSYLSCNDGVLNGDEDGVDCGGSCKSCVFSISGCEEFLDNNKVEGAGALISIENITSSISGGKFTVLGTNNTGDSIKFTFANEEVKYFESYNPTSNINLDSSKVFIEARFNSLPYGGFYKSVYYYKSDEFSESNVKERRIHLNKENGKFIISFCDLELLEPIGGSQISFKGKLTEN